MCMTPWTVRLAISVAHSSPSRYSEEKGSLSWSGPHGALRRSTGNRSRSVGTLEPRPASGESHPSRSPTFHRIAQSVRAAREGPCDGTPEAISCTSRGKSSGPPGVGSAHTSSSRKSRVSSWIRQGREVCAVFGSLIHGPPSIRSPWVLLSHGRRTGQGDCDIFGPIRIGELRISDLGADPRHGGRRRRTPSSRSQRPLAIPSLWDPCGSRRLTVGREGEGGAGLVVKRFFDPARRWSTCARFFPYVARRTLSHARSSCGTIPKPWARLPAPECGGSHRLRIRLGAAWLVPRRSAHRGAPSGR